MYTVVFWSVGLFGGMDFKNKNKRFNVQVNDGFQPTGCRSKLWKHHQFRVRFNGFVGLLDASDSKQQKFTGWDMPRWCPDEAGHLAINFIRIYDSILHDGTYDLPWQKRTRFGQPPQLEVSPILTGETSPKVSSDINFCTFNSHVPTFRPRFLHSQVPPKPLKATIWHDLTISPIHLNIGVIQMSINLIQDQERRPWSDDPHLIHWKLPALLLFVASIWREEIWWSPDMGLLKKAMILHDVWDICYISKHSRSGSIKMYITTIHPVSLLITTARRKENMSLKVKNIHLFKGFSRHRIDSKFFDVSSTNVGRIFSKKYIYIYTYIHIHLPYIFSRHGDRVDGRHSS